jgi:SWIM zinc finger
VTQVWTTDQVLALAPDAGSAKNGQALAAASKWSNIGRQAHAVWGECQGSGKDPYRTQIDLSEPAFRCSCPSRKFPCKHGLGLFLLLAKQGSFAEAEPPAWVAEWLAKRSQTKAAKAETSTAPAAKTVDPAAQAKRQQKRESKVQAGLAELDLWLQDLIHQGLAQLPSQPYGYWDQVAARMVDAQAPGLARRLRRMAEIASGGQTDWASTLLAELGKLHLLIQGYLNQANLPPGLQAEVRSQVGWTISQDELLSTAAPDQLLSDDWWVVGKQVELDDLANLKIQRVWLWGLKQQRFALILSFAPRHLPIDASWLPGLVVPAELCFFPSSFPLRALARNRGESYFLNAVAGSINLTENSLTLAIHGYSQALSQTPWLETYPLLLSQVTPRLVEEQWLLVDSEGMAVPLEADALVAWRIMALSGGKPLTLAGEWDGQVLRPLSVWAEQRFWPVPIKEV